MFKAIDTEKRTSVPQWISSPRFRRFLNALAISVIAYTSAPTNPTFAQDGTPPVEPPVVLSQAEIDALDNKVFLSSVISAPAEVLNPEDAVNSVKFVEFINYLTGKTEMGGYPEVSILGQNGKKENFPGRSELLSVTPNFQNIVRSTIEAYNENRKLFELTQWKPSLNTSILDGVSMQVTELPALAGASRYDTRTEEQIIFTQLGSPWELFRFYAELVIPQSNYHRNEAVDDFMNSDGMREVVIRRLTAHYMKEYIKECEAKHAAGESFPMMQLWINGGIQRTTPEAYIEFMKQELQTRVSGTGMAESPMGNALPERLVLDQESQEYTPYFGERFLFVSTNGSKRGLGDLVEGQVQEVYEIVEKVIQDWRNQGNVISNEAVFAMYFKIFHQGGERNADGSFPNYFPQFDDHMGWKNLINNMKVALREAGVTIDAQRFFDLRDEIEELPVVAQTGHLLAFEDRDNPQIIELHVAGLSNDTRSGINRASQDEVNTDVHLPLEIAYYLKIPETNTMLWVVVPAQAYYGNTNKLTLQLHRVITVNKPDSDDFWNIDITNIPTPVQIRTAQTEVGGVVIPSQRFQLVATIPAGIGAAGAEEIGTASMTNSEDGSIEFDPTILTQLESNNQ